MRQGIFLPESTSGADSLTVSAEPPCAITCINICAHVNFFFLPNTGNHTIVWTHSLIGMKWVALLLRLLYFIHLSRPEFRTWDKELLKKITIIITKQQQQQKQKQQRTESPTVTLTWHANAHNSQLRHPKSQVGVLKGTSSTRQLRASPTP